MREFYDIFCARSGGYLRRRLGAQDATDLAHDVFLVVVEAIRRDELRESARLMGFVRTVLQRRIATHLRATMRHRSCEQEIEDQVSLADCGMRPDHNVECRERAEMMQQVFSSLSSREREVLDRFYLQEQSAQQIRSEMRLTCTNYRVLKSRAKTKFGEAGRERLARVGSRHLRVCA
ncbi:MAG TPA: sigma-70 family RNA polymerase sigma factor [Bryobacteraceae bacterium]